MLHDYNKVMPKRRLPPKDFEWTTELAYAVGLLVTDGNLSGNGRCINLHSAEMIMIDTFKKCLNLKNRTGIETKKNGDISYRVQFSNVQFYDWLMRIGLFPAKSYTIGPILVPDKFFPDYFRGCIDGDGCISTYSDQYNVYKNRRYTTQRLFIRLVSASRVHMEWAQNKITYFLRIRGALIERPPGDEKRVPMWELKFAKKDSLRLIAWMYYTDDIPCLERKRTIARTAIELINKQKRREYTKIVNPK
jgi:hypothetical protein